MILNAKLVVILCFTLCHFETFAKKSPTSRRSKPIARTSSKSNETCPLDLDKYFASMTKAQWLEKEMTRDQFEKDFGKDSLKVVRKDAVKEVEKPYPVCHKECKARRALGGVCSWVCGTTAPPEPPPLPDRDIQFFLFTSEKPTVSQKLTAFTDAPWKDVKLINGADTFIICHGFMSDPKSGPGEKLREEYFKLYKLRKRPVNIILVDWSPAARAWQKHSDTGVAKRVYFPPAVYVWGVGHHTKLLIRKLMSRGKITLDQMHLIGHSLGAQAMGYAGKILSGDSDMKLDRQVGRITALDPAAPCFEKGSWLNSFCIDKKEGYLPITRDDAKFVDVIHSNAALFGMTNPVGHVDFYPNGGKYQPGCWCLDMVCSHSRSIDLMAASINGDKKNYRGAVCSDVNAALKRTCKSTKEAKFNFLGHNVDKTAPSHGIYYLPTLDKPPYTSKF